MKKVSHINKGMLSSEDHDWETPEYLFDYLNNEFGPFDLDVCATWKNTKCVNFFGKQKDGRFISGLEFPWHQFTKSCWMNPPYGKEIVKWVRKADEESCKGVYTCALLPARVDTKWFHTYVRHHELFFHQGRITFVGAKSSAPFPSLVVMFGPNPPGIRELVSTP